MPIITLPDHQLSRSAASRSTKWMKILTGVDASLADGYAFLGAFANHGDTVEVADNAWVLGYIADVRSSGRLDGRNVTLYQVRGGALAEVDAWYLDASKGWALKVRDEIAALMAAPAPAPSTDALLAERAQLLARLAEIDELLPGIPGPAVQVREVETVWCEAPHGDGGKPHFERPDCIHPFFTDQRTRARMNAAAITNA
jgi:hypothetical protein